MRRSTLLVAAIILLAVGAGLATAAERYNVDADHGLDKQSAIQAFEAEGVVQTEVTTPHLTVTIAKSASDCDADTGLFSDARNDFLCIQYHNDLPQTTRLWIPDAYWTPFVHENKQPVGDGPVASFQPVRHRNYTSVVVRFDGSATAVYAIPRDVTASYALINRINERTQTIAGVELWSGGTQWRYVNTSAFGSSPSIAIKTKPDRTMIQYDATPNETGGTWVSVPEGESSTSPVYRMQRPGEPQTVYIIADTRHPPPIRYRARGTGIAAVDSAFKEIRTIDEKIGVAIDRMLPDWLW